MQLEPRTIFTFELEPSGMSRNYKTAETAKREARKQYKRLCEQVGGCCDVYCEVFKITFNPYSKTKILELPE